MISREWLAGFFDADGYVGVVRGRSGVNKGYLSLRLSITNCNRNLLLVVQQWYGGRLSSKGKRVKEQHRDWFHLVWHGKEAQRMANLLLPFSVNKADQLTLALKFPVGRPGARRDLNEQSAVCDLLASLKREG